MVDAKTEQPGCLPSVAIQRITFVPRVVAGGMVPPPGAVLISIHDLSQPQLAVQDGWKAVLYLRFHDTDGMQLGLEQFTADQAQSALDFVREHGGVCTHLFVNCSEGRSRSAAVAMVLSELLGVPCYKEDLRVSPLTHPGYNRVVHSRLLKTALNEPGEVFLHWCGYI